MNSSHRNIAAGSPQLKSPHGATQDAPSESQASTSTSTKARARKGGVSRSAREAQRKLNHSVIEKARRTKINDALGRLKHLVPADFGRDVAEASEDALQKSNEDKEFKLDILVKTVSFVEHLLERISELEQNADVAQDRGEEAGVASAPPAKRKLAEDSLSDTGTSKSRRIENASISSSPSGSPPRLPPISTFFDNMDPRLLRSPQARPIIMDSSTYLPSPPTSGRFESITRASHPLPDFTLNEPLDDENAASLLLHMKASPAALGGIAQTPSSLLGLLR